MGHALASRLGFVKASPSMAAKARVDALVAAGRTIVDFTLGEPDFDTPAHIVQGGIDALHRGETRYTAALGTPALRAAIAAKLGHENGLSFTPAQVVVGCGAKHILFNALAATLEPGDEVLVPAPFWVSYPDMVALCGGKPVIVASTAEEGFKLTARALEEAITPRTRWLVLNTPNNPSGAVYTESELAALAEVLRRHPRVWLLTDEIYEHFVYGGARHVSPLRAAPDLADRALVVNGLSKSFAMTGWRIGYAAGPLELVRGIGLLNSQSTSCASAMGQAAAVVALEGPQDCVRAATALFAGRRERMATLLDAVPGVACARPDGAFYAFPDVRGLLGARTPAGLVLATDGDVAAYFLEEAGVACIDGTSYGQPGFLRFSFATSTQAIERGCEAIGHAVAGLSRRPPTESDNNPRSPR